MNALLNSSAAIDIDQIDQIVHDGFLCEAVDALTSVADVREFYELPDEIEDDEIEAAIKSAAKGCSFPSGTIVLALHSAYENGKPTNINSGAIWAAVDVYADWESYTDARQLSVDSVDDLADELSGLSGRTETLESGEPHPDDRVGKDITVYEAIILPRRARGYAATDRTDRGISLGFYHTASDAERDVLDDLDAAA